MTRSDVMKHISSSDTAHAVNMLEYLGTVGEASAQQMGYADAVSRLMYHPDPEVAGAAAAALGNMGTEGTKYMTQMAAMLKHESPKARSMAAEALGRLGPWAQDFGHSVIELLKDDNFFVRLVAVRSLGFMGCFEAVTDIEELLMDPCPEVAAAACETLGYMGCIGESELLEKLGNTRTRCSALVALIQLAEDAPINCAPAVVDCLDTSDPTTRQTALDCIGVMSGAVLSSNEAIDNLLKLLNSTEPGTRAAAATAFGALGEPAKDHATAVAALLDDDAHDDTWVALAVGNGSKRAPANQRIPKCAAMVALASMQDTQFLNQISDGLNDAVWEVRLCAVEALGLLGTLATSESIPLQEVLDDPAFVIRAKACEALGKLQAEDAIGRLVDKFEDKAHTVRSAAVMALAAIGTSAQDFSHEVLRMLVDPVPKVRVAVIHALASFGDFAKGYAGIIGAQLNDTSAEVRAEAIVSLALLGGEYSSAFVVEVAQFLNDPEPAVRSAAQSALPLMGEAGTAYSKDPALRLDLAGVPMLTDKLPGTIPKAPSAGQSIGLDGLGAMYSMLSK